VRQKPCSTDVVRGTREQKFWEMFKVNFTQVDSTPDPRTNRFSNPNFYPLPCSQHAARPACWCATFKAHVCTVEAELFHHDAKVFGPKPRLCGIASGSIDWTQVLMVPGLRLSRSKSGVNPVLDHANGRNAGFGLRLEGRSGL
jgi:hypothetical protein